MLLSVILSSYFVLCPVLTSLEVNAVILMRWAEVANAGAAAAMETIGAVQATVRTTERRDGVFGDAADMMASSPR